MKHLMKTLKMGYIPIDDLLTYQQQEQVAKLFRFGTEEDIELFEQSVNLSKTKSERDNSTNQRFLYQANKRKSKRIKKNIKSLERQSEIINVIDCLDVGFLN